MRFPIRAIVALAAVSLASLAVSSAPAVTVTIGSSRDNTLYEDSLGRWSSGAGPIMFCGNTQPGSGLRRALILFDIAAALPESAIVDSVKMRLHVSRANNNLTPLPARLRKVTTNWGEAGSNAGPFGGQGTSAQIGDATWLYTFFNTNTWTSPGGDFVPTNSDSQSVGPKGFYTWGSTAAMVADVQGWRTSPATNFGWLILGDIDEIHVAKGFDTRESDSVAFRPEMTIDYHLPSQPSGVGLPSGASDVVRLGANSPNPFRTQTTLDFSLAQAGRARLSIVDAEGRVVATLVDRVETAGPHKTVWNGRDANGDPAASGVYFMRLESSGGTAARAIVLTR